MWRASAHEQLRSLRRRLPERAPLITRWRRFDPVTTSGRALSDLTFRYYPPTDRSTATAAATQGPSCDRLTRTCSAPAISGAPDGARMILVPAIHGITNPTRSVSSARASAELTAGVGAQPRFLADSQTPPA